jgi:hypothetical protein
MVLVNYGFLFCNIWFNTPPNLRFALAAAQVSLFQRLILQGSLSSGDCHADPGEKGNAYKDSVLNQTVL